MPPRSLVHLRRLFGSAATPTLAALCAALAGAFGTAAAEPGAQPSSSLLEDGGFFEIGVGTYVDSSVWAREVGDERASEADVELVLAGSWRRGRFFIEATGLGREGLGIGATLWHDERRTLDFLAAHLPSSIDVAFHRGQDSVDAASSERERNIDLLERDSLLGTSGLRLRQYQGDWLGEVSAVVDWQNGNGMIANARLGRQWQFGNWNLTAVSGVGYVTADLVDFLAGVDENEASGRFPVYRAGGAGFVEADIALSRAIGKRLVWRSSLSGWKPGDGFTDSPLTVRSASGALDTSISYVF